MTARLVLQKGGTIKSEFPSKKSHKVSVLKIRVLKGRRHDLNRICMSSINEEIRKWGLKLMILGVCILKIVCFKLLRLYKLPRDELMNSTWLQWLFIIAWKSSSPTDRFQKLSWFSINLNYMLLLTIENFYHNISSK